MQFTTVLTTATPFRDIVAGSAHLFDPLQKARHLLKECLTQSDLIADLPFMRRPGSYERNFLFGDHTMSVWAMVWDQGARTSIHDHHCSCSFLVLSGQLTERWFEATGHDTAVQTAEAARRPGFMACMVPTGPNIHQMVNTTDAAAVSIHVYGFDRELHSSSVEREYRLAPTQ